MRRSEREYRIRVVDGLQCLCRLSVLSFLRPNHPHLPRPAGRRCHSQETTPMSIEVADVGRVFRCFVGFAQERGHASTFDPMATVVAPLSLE